MAKLDDLAERVDRLVLRHQELKRSSALIEQQLMAAPGWSASAARRRRARWPSLPRRPNRLGLQRPQPHPRKSSRCAVTTVLAP